MQFLIKWWMQQLPMSQKVQKTVEAPRMWYMNTIVDMLQMEAHQVPFPERVEGGERRSGCTNQDWCSRYVSKSVLRRSKVNEILATILHDSTVLETNVEESKAKIVSDTDQAVYALK